MTTSVIDTIERIEALIAECKKAQEDLRKKLNKKGIEKCRNTTSF